MTTPEAKRPLTGEGWIEWTGGLRPHPASTLVRVRYRDGSEDEGQSAFAHWWHEDNGRDIIAYRLARPAHPEPAGGGEAVAWLYTENRWKDGPRHRLSIKRQSISDEDMNEFEIVEQPLYASPPSADADKLLIAREALEPFAAASLDRESQNVKTLPGGASVRVTLAHSAGNPTPHAVGIANGDEPKILRGMGEER